MLWFEIHHQRHHLGKSIFETYWKFQSCSTWRTPRALQAGNHDLQGRQPEEVDYEDDDDDDGDDDRVHNKEELTTVLEASSRSSSSVRILPICESM